MLPVSVPLAAPPFLPQGERAQSQLAGQGLAEPGPRSSLMGQVGCLWPPAHLGCGSPARMLE